jgi:hypothetical protein
MDGYNSDDDLLSGPQLGLSGFLETPGPEFGSPGSAAAAGFGSPGSASSQKKRCPHNLRKDACRKCWNQYNADRISKGLAPEAWGIFCKHGINKFTKSCTNPECVEQRGKSIVYTDQEPESRGTMQFQQPTGVIPDSARMFEPPIPRSAGLSFSPLEASQVNPVKKNLFGSSVFDNSDDEMSGGRRKYSKKSKRKARKSSRKSKKKARKSSRKSSRKARKSSRK